MRRHVDNGHFAVARLQKLNAARRLQIRERWVENLVLRRERGEVRDVSATLHEGRGEQAQQHAVAARAVVHRDAQVARSGHHA